MVSRFVRPLFLVLSAALLCSALPAQGGQPPSLTVHAIWGSPEFAGDVIELAWAPDGKTYTTIDEDTAGGTDLYRVDAATGAKQLLVRGRDLVPPGATRPIGIEAYSFSEDGTKLLIFTNAARVWRQNTKGTFFVWDFAARRLTPVSANPGYQQFAKFSPDGRLVGFVRNNNIFVTDLATATETALTRDGRDNVINGTADWV